MLLDKYFRSAASRIGVPARAVPAPQVHWRTCNAASRTGVPARAVPHALAEPRKRAAVHLQRSQPHRRTRARRAGAPRKRPASAPQTRRSTARKNPRAAHVNRFFFFSI